MTQQLATPLGFLVAEEIPPISVSGSYDQDSQLWVGDGTVGACGTKTYSATSCTTTTLSQTNCGFDNDSDYDNCGDYDPDTD